MCRKAKQSLLNEASNEFEGLAFNLSCKEIPFVGWCCVVESRWNNALNDEAFAW
jgi:hypothetical protein